MASGSPGPSTISPPPALPDAQELSVRPPPDSQWHTCRRGRSPRGRGRGPPRSPRPRSPAPRAGPGTHGGWGVRGCTGPEARGSRTPPLNSRSFSGREKKKQFWSEIGSSRKTGRGIPWDGPNPLPPPRGKKTCVTIPIDPRAAPASSATRRTSPRTPEGTNPAGRTPSTAPPPLPLPSNLPFVLLR